MRVDQLMNSGIHTCCAGDTLAYAAQQMWTQDCGCLPVIDPEHSGRVVGIITDRDICMCALFQGKPLSSLVVGDAMARDVKTCHPADSTDTAEKVMREARVRRLPVIDDGGAMVGILSLADLAREAAREQCAPRKYVTGDEIGITLASICEPAT